MVFVDLIGHCRGHRREIAAFRKVIICVSSRCYFSVASVTFLLHDSFTVDLIRTAFCRMDLCAHSCMFFLFSVSLPCHELPMASKTITRNSRQGRFLCCSGSFICAFVNVWLRVSLISAHTVSRFTPTPSPGSRQRNLLLSDDKYALVVIAFCHCQQ